MGDPITITIIVKGILAAILALGGIYTLRIGYKLYIHGVGTEKEDASINIGNLKVTTKTIGSFVMSTSCVWVIFCYLSAPTYIEQNGKKAVESILKLSKTEQFIEFASAGATDILKDYVNKGIDVNVKNDKGENALIGAVSGGYIKTAEYLIDVGTDTATKTNDNRTALSVAKSKGFTSIVIILKEAGAKE